MSRKFLIDITDSRFFVSANEDVLAFIRRANPFAHSDVGSVLFALGKQIPGAHAYCPSVSSLAYVVLHTASDRIVAIAFDQRGLAFRLGAPAYADAIADGGTEAPTIGPDWMRFDPWAVRPVDTTYPHLQRWAERAFADAAASQE